MEFNKEEKIKKIGGNELSERRDEIYVMYK
jgi:hypothetical protein